VPNSTSGFLIIAAVLTLTFAAGITLQPGWGSPVALDAGSRVTDARCPQSASNSRSACPSNAPGTDAWAHAVVNSSGGELGGLRARTDAGIDAGDKDGIVIEPACNVVARGSRSVCEARSRPWFDSRKII